MSEPSELELLILPYLSGELGPEDTARIETAIADHPEFARLVEEFRTTLSFFEMDELDVAEVALDAVLEDMYAEIATRQTRPTRAQKFLSSWLRPLRDGFHALPVWLRISTSGAAATIAIALALTFGRGPVPAPFSPIALMNPPGEAFAPANSESRHERFIRVELQRRLDNAQLIQYGRGDATRALSLYDGIMHTSPNSWASRVAETERSQILRSASVLVSSQTPEPLFAETTQP